MTILYAHLEEVDCLDLREWTFPSFRHLLEAVPSSRHPRIEDPRRILPVGCVAMSAGEPVGLALGCLPLNNLPDNMPELLSLFVRPDRRRQGIGRGLVKRFGEQVAEPGFSIVTATYSTGTRGNHESLERLFADLGWAGPQTRVHFFHFSIEQVLGFSWFEQFRLRKSLAIFPWAELAPEALEDLRRSHEEHPWIDDQLLPWFGDVNRLDPVCSLGVRQGDRIVGWMLCHRHDDLTLRYTTAFIRSDLARLAQLLPVWAESVRRAGEQGYERLMFTVDHRRLPMTRFVDHWCEAPLLSYESRWVWKRFEGGQRFVPLEVAASKTDLKIPPSRSAGARRTSPVFSTTEAQEGSPP